MTRNHVLVLAAVTMIGAWAVVWLRQDGDSSFRKPDSLSPASVERVVPSAAPELLEPALELSGDPTRIVVPVTEQPTIEQVLRRHWGADCVRILEEAARSGLDLRQQVESPPAWEEVVGEVCERIALADSFWDSLDAQYLWPDRCSAEFVAKEFGADGAGPILEPEMAVMDGIAATFQPQIREGIRRYRELLEGALRQTRERQQFRKAPLFLPNEHLHEKIIMSGAAVVRGWTVGYTILERDHPEVKPAKRRLGELKQQRTAEIVAYLRSR